MANIEIFKNERFGEVRVAGTSEQPLFCLADVCKAIGITNARNVKDRLDEEDVRLVDTLTAGGMQKLTYVTESGMYDVIMRSDSDKAKPFRKWVTSEVLPSIRKTGSYSVQKQYEIPQSYSEALMLAAKQAQQIEEARDEKFTESFAVDWKVRIFAVLYKLKGGKVRKSLWAIFMPTKKHIRFHAPVSQVNAATAFEVYSNGAAWNRFLFHAKQTF